MQNLFLMMHFSTNIDRILSANALRLIYFF
jgi:hypothetical protein